LRKEHQTPNSSRHAAFSFVPPELVEGPPRFVIFVSPPNPALHALRQKLRRHEGRKEGHEGSRAETIGIRHEPARLAAGAPAVNAAADGIAVNRLAI